MPIALRFLFDGSIALQAVVLLKAQFTGGLVAIVLIIAGLIPTRIPIALTVVSSFLTLAGCLSTAQRTVLAMLMLPILRLNLLLPSSTSTTPTLPCFLVSSCLPWWLVLVGEISEYVYNKTFFFPMRPPMTNF